MVAGSASQTSDVDEDRSDRRFSTCLSRIPRSGVDPAHHRVRPTSKAGGSPKQSAEEPRAAGCRDSVALLRLCCGEASEQRAELAALFWPRGNCGATKRWDILRRSSEQIK